MSFSYLLYHENILKRHEAKYLINLQPPPLPLALPTLQSLRGRETGWVFLQQHLQLPSRLAQRTAEGIPQLKDKIKDENMADAVDMMRNETSVHQN